LGQLDCAWQLHRDAAASCWGAGFLALRLLSLVNADALPPFEDSSSMYGTLLLAVAAAGLCGQGVGVQPVQ
jgi:hypothetical protein